MTTTLDVHIKDYSGREFGGKYTADKIDIVQGRILVNLQYCGSKSSKRLTTAWLDIDESLVAEISAAMSQTKLVGSI